MVLLGLPGIKGDESPAEITKLSNLSQLWQIELLKTFCRNITMEDTDFNPSISVQHNSEMGAKLRDGFLQTRTWADIYFSVEGKQLTLTKPNNGYGPNKYISHDCDVQYNGTIKTM